MFEKGDNFVLYTKYGGVIVGEVESIHNNDAICRQSKCVIRRQYIKTTKGMTYSVDGSDGKIYKMIRKVPEEEFNAYVKNLDEFTKVINEHLKKK